MRIGDLAAAAGVSPRALRYYEEQGLLTAERSASGQRHYPEDAVGRVRWIQALYAAGLNSAGVRDMMPCMATGKLTDEMFDRLTGERDRLAAQIQELSETRTRLDEMITAAGHYR
jgi:DNA-binding transcriptional MerR regulator